MDYNHIEIEKNWRKYWAENKTFKAEETSDKPKFYSLDMFPYPSGAGLHVGHPLGYIASDIYSRYKRHQGFNVLHPMGYDSFGLPAEQYAIQTGQHPAVTTKTNIEGGTDKAGNKIPGYRNQLDIMGFSFDWDREVRTSSPEYYKWTQWIFKQIFSSWYNEATNKAEDITTLITVFEQEGNANVKATTDQETIFTAEEWSKFTEKEQQAVLMNYRLTFLSDTYVNWCSALGTVLANDEIKDGVSERGGHPVERKLMRQWSMRITAYANRLIQDLDTVDWTDSIKEQQKNWIGKSRGASVKFQVENGEDLIEVFTTRPDTIFGVNFMVLAPEHELVNKITTANYKAEVEAYQQKAKLKSERDRQANVKEISGQNTGAFAIHPFTGEKVQIWIGDYVLASYGTGAVMAVPAGDQRDWDFANHFGIEIKNIFGDTDISEGAYEGKDAELINSDFLNGLKAKKAIGAAIKAIQEKEIGKGKTQFRLRDAIFSRQRYWGEPFPVYYKDDIPYLIEDDKLPVKLPEVDKYLPTEDGEPPLARAEKEAWNVFEGDRMEFNTMPGWAGSSWYFLRYMDPSNQNELVSKEKADYWSQVDLYIGGAEHATGHLLYSRFWCKFLFDKGLISFNEPFKKMINQGMILGRSSFVYRDKESNKFVSFGLRKEYKTTRIPVDINIVDNDVLDKESFKNWREEYANAEFITEENGDYICGHEIEKMSKSKFNVQTPDELVEKYGADTLRCYEMFLGPLEQAKPWDTKGISGVSNFLKRLWRLFHQNETFTITEGEPDKKALKSLHTIIKKASGDLERYSFNTIVSGLMIAVNDFTEQKCNNKEVLSQLLIIASPYAPHITEELWSKLGNSTSISTELWPVFNPKFLEEDAYAYPVSFNGKMRFLLELPTNLGKEDIEREVLAAEQSQKYLEGKTPKKVIVVPKRIVNIVI
jgi:leucyl-tRNA synthetase